MRSSWLEFVRRVRSRENRGKKTCSYREAMKIASETWPKEKKKRLKRDRKSCLGKVRYPKVPTKPPAEKTCSSIAENGKDVNV